MRRSWGLGVVVVLSVSSVAWAGKEGALKVTASVEDGNADGCTVKAFAAGSQAHDRAENPGPVGEGAAGSDVTVPPGKYDVLTECQWEGAPISALNHGVTVAAGKPTALTVKMEKGALIAHGVHGDNRVSKGEYRLFHSGTVLEAGKAAVGARVTVAAGVYDLRLETEVDGEPCVVMMEKQTVKAGRPQVVSVNVSVGMLKLDVTRNGKPAEGGGAVTFPGQVNRIKEFTSGEPVPVSPGTYDVLGSLASSFDFTEKRQRKVVIEPGKVTNLSMDLPRGTISTHCTVDGREVPGTVFGYLPGASDYFNSAPCGQVLEVSPAKYHLKLVIDVEKAGYKVLGAAAAPEVMMRNVAVEKGKNKDVNADFSPARIKVTAKKNNVETEAAITVIKAGGAAVGGGPAGQELPIAPGRYDLEVMFPSKRGPSKELVRGVDCAAGKTCAVGVNLERATFVLEVVQGGEVKPDGEVLLYKEGSELPYAKGKSGEELEVPPGDYVPEVRVGAAKRQIHKVKLRAGDHEPARKVEVD